MLVYGYFCDRRPSVLFAVYLPEAFFRHVFERPAKAFCWNAARSLTAIGPLIGGWLVAEFGSFSGCRKRYRIRIPRWRRDDMVWARDARCFLLSD